MPTRRLVTTEENWTENNKVREKQDQKWQTSELCRQKR